MLFEWDIVFGIFVRLMHPNKFFFFKDGIRFSNAEKGWLGSKATLDIVLDIQ